MQRLVEEPGQCLPLPLPDVLDPAPAPVVQQDWAGAEVAALELARSHGRARPSLAARFLCLAGSARGVTAMKTLLLQVGGRPQHHTSLAISVSTLLTRPPDRPLPPDRDLFSSPNPPTHPPAIAPQAAPSHQPEALAIRQADQLREALPDATSSHHYQQVLRVPSTQCRVCPDSVFRLWPQLNPTLPPSLPSLPAHRLPPPLSCPPPPSCRRCRQPWPPPGCPTAC